jgi:hypothetical protein
MVFDHETDQRRTGACRTEAEAELHGVVGQLLDVLHTELLDLRVGYPKGDASQNCSADEPIH